MKTKEREESVHDDPQVGILNHVSRALAILTIIIGLLVLIGWISDINLLKTILPGSDAVAPSTAELLVVLGILTVLTTARIKSGILRLIPTILTGIVLLLSISLFIVSSQGITTDLEYIGLRGTSAETAHIPPLAAVCFILIGISVLGNLIDRKPYILVALATSFITTFTGLILMVVYMLGNPVIPESGFLLPTLTTSIAFILIGCSLFLPTWIRAKKSGSIVSILQKKHALVLVITFIVVTVSFSFISHASLKSYRQFLSSDIREQLISITDLKASQLISWQGERIGDAAVYHKNENFASLVESVLLDRDNPKKTEALKRRMRIEQKAHFYDHVYLIDQDYKLVQDAPEHNHEVPEQVIENAETAMRENRVVFVDFYKNSQGMLELAVLSPIYSNRTGRPLGTLCMVVNPEQNLLPDFVKWPNSYKTSRIQLLRIRKEQFRMIGRTDSGHYMCQELHCGNPAHIAHMIIEGQQGILNGLNCEGKKVKAMFQEVPGTPWFVLAEIETSEVFQPLRQRLWLLLTAQIIILLSAFFIIELLWRKQRNESLAHQIEIQDELLQERTEYKRAIDSLIEGFQILSHEWKYVYINPKAADYGKNPLEEYLGKTVFEMYPGIEATELFQRFQQCVENRAPDHFEYEFVYPDQTREWFLFSVQPTEKGLVILTSNITNRKQAELRVDHLNRVLRSIRDVNQLIVHETHEDVLIKCACDILVQNQSYRNAIVVLIDEDLKPNQWFTAGQEQPRSLMESVFEKNVMPVCYQNALKDGEYYCIAGETHSCPTCPLIPEYSGSQSFVMKLEHNSDVFGILHVIMEIDIIADKEEEGLIEELANDVSYALNMMRNIKQKKALEQQLQQGRKLEAIGRLAGGVAHDFNNMLQSILGYSDILLEEFSLEDEQREFLLEIKKAARRSADLTYQLLAFSRKQTIELKTIDINKMIHEMLKMLRRLISENIELDWKPGADILSIRMDPTQINQILMNLTINASDAIKGNGTIVIETMMLHLDMKEKLERFELEEGNYVVLSVSDTGEGIKKENIDKIFEPFFTTKEMGKGTGLGLATIYGIVKQNRGNISVYSEVDRGTTFRVYLPAFMGKDFTEESVMKITPPKGVETIMLVEDSEQLLILTQRQLEKLGYRVQAFRDPEKAVEAYNPEQMPDLLLTDVIMPSMSGRELWDILREKTPDLNCLFMSGYTSNVISHHGVLDAGIHFISKPFTIKDIALKIREILSG